MVRRDAVWLITVRQVWNVPAGDGQARYGSVQFGEVRQVRRGSLGLGLVTQVRRR